MRFIEPAGLELTELYAPEIKKKGAKRRKTKLLLKKLVTRSLKLLS